MKKLYILVAFLVASLIFGPGVYSQVSQPGVQQKGAITSGHVATWAGNNLVQDGGNPSGTGTVTSIGVVGDGQLFSSTFTGSPVTGSGTFNFGTASLAHGPNQFFATSATTTGTGSWRAIVGSDLPIATSSVLGSAFFPSAGGLSITATGGVQIQVPGTSQLGGILAASGATSNSFVTYIDTSGAQHVAQPTWSNIGGGFLGFAQGGTGIGTIGSANQCLQVNSGATGYTFGNCNGPAGNSSSLSTLFAATSTNTFDNANYAQTWTWNSLSTQNALTLSTSTATTGKVFSSIITSAGNTGYAGYFQNASTSGYGVYVSGAENITGALTGAAANFSGTLTASTAQILAGNATLTALTAITVTAGTYTGSNAALTGTTTLTSAQILGGNAVVTNMTATTASATNAAISSTTTTNNLTITGTCTGCKGLKAGTQLVINPYDQTTHNIAHGLGAIPALYDVRLVNLTTNLGYSPGQSVVVGGPNVNGANAAFTIAADATNTYYSGSSPISIVQANTSGSATITNADWELVITPYVIGN